MMKEEVKVWLHEQFGDDDETIGVVWNEYLEATTAKLAEARAALEGADYPLLDRIAHTLKGNALMVSDQAAVAASLALRDAAKASDAAGAAKAIGELTAINDENHR